VALRASNYRLNNIEHCHQKGRENALKRKYGITEEDYALLLNNQSGKCAICEKLPSRNKLLSVDHNHSTKAIRGLLCDYCNSSIGWLEQESSRIEKASEYLKRG
jgi:hypothetical protein